MAPLGFLPALPPIKYFREDAHSWETPSPFRVPIWVVPPLVFHQYILFTLCKRSFSAPFEMGGHKNVRNKIRRKYHPLQNINRGRSRQTRHRTDEYLTRSAQFSPRGRTSIASSPCGLMGLIATSFLGKHVTRCSPLGSALPLAIWGSAGKPGLSPFMYQLFEHVSRIREPFGVTRCGFGYPHPGGWG
jgi:hypothetical protein